MKSKFTYIISVILLINNAAFSQITWNKSFDSTGCNSVVQNHDGSYTMAGSSPVNNTDFLVKKLDSLGNSIWIKTYGGSGADNAACIVASPTDSGYVVVGNTTSFGSTLSDILILKLDKNGNLIWQKMFGTTAQDIAYSMIQTLDNGFIITAATWGYSGGSQAWLLKIDNIGNFQWQKRYGGNNGYHYARSIVQNQDSSYIVCGNTDYLGASGSNDVYVFKVDKTGNEIWQKTLGGAGTDVGYTAIRTKDNHYVISGFTNSFNLTSSSLWLVKLDTLGNIKWEKSYGDTNNVMGSNYNNGVPQSVVETSDGGLAATCYTNTYWLLKTDSLGNIEWQNSYGSNGINFTVLQSKDKGYLLPGNGAWSIKTDVNGDVAMTCYNSTYVQPTITNANINNVLIVGQATNVIGYSVPVTSSIQNLSSTDSCITTLDIDRNSLSNFSIYPNPSSGILNLNIDSNGAKDIKIYDSFGKIVLTRSKTEDEIFDISHLSEGIYTITVMKWNQKLMKRLIILK